MANNTIIFGDSYSTFDGYIPEGYAAYYAEVKRAETDVVKVEQTWWHQVVEKAGLNLVMNNSWSGSTIGYTGYQNSDCSGTSSFIYRLRKLKAEGFFAENRIDTVLVFGGTNDDWAGVPHGTLKFADFQEEELYTVLPAIACFLKSLKETLPEAKLYCLINTEMNPVIAEAFQKACAQYGIIPITFTHIHKEFGHPTIQGMRDIAQQVLAVLNRA